MFPSPRPHLDRASPSVVFPLRSSSRLQAFLVALGLLLLLAGLPGGSRHSAAQNTANAAGDTQASDADLASLAWGANRFTVELYRELASRADGKNLFFSPESIHMALSMVALGAEGATEREMRRVLHLAVPGEGLLPALRERRDRLGVTETSAVARATGATRPAPIPKDGKVPWPPSYDLRIANALWAQEGFPFRGEYLDSVSEAFHARLALVDFARAFDAAGTINRWVEEATRGRIRGIVSPDSLKAESRLVLVLTNAIYFKCAWSDPFPKKLTKPLPFHLLGARTVEAPLMTMQEDFGYFEEGGEAGVQVVKLPYAALGLSLLVVLPRATEGLPQLERALTVDRLATWRKGLVSRPVVVTLPRFRIETQLDLQEPLAALGMKRAFSNEAEFNRMTEAAGLSLSAVTHQAFVAVDEEGTEAAAATGVMKPFALNDSEPEPPVDFTADHPFLFFIRLDATGAILFAGRVLDPSSTEPTG